MHKFTRQFLSILLISHLWSISVAQNHKPEGGPFKLVKSENFAQPIKSWLFEKTSKQPAGPLLAIQPEQITWLKGHPAQSLDLPSGYLETVFSKSGGYFGMLSLNPASAVEDARRTLQIDVYTFRGEKLYRLQRTHYYDDAFPAVAISDLDGAAVLSHNATGKLWFYNNRGRLTQEVTLFPQAEYDLERSQHLALSADGSALTVAASNRSSVPGSENAATVQEAQVFLFRANGERLWRSILPENWTALTALSTDGKFTAVGCYNSDDPANIKKRTLLFDGAGQRIGEAKILFIMAAFSPDSKYLILADNHAVEMLELASGQTLWTQNLNRQHGRLTAVALSNAADFAIALIAKSHFKANTFVFSEPRLRVYSRTGTMVQEISFAGEEFATSALTLSDNARALAIGFKNSYYLFEAHR